MDINIDIKKRVDMIFELSKNRKISMMDANEILKNKVAPLQQEPPKTKCLKKQFNDSIAQKGNREIKIKYVNSEIKGKHLAVIGKNF